MALNVSTLPGDNTTAPPKGVTTQPQDSKGEDQPSGTTNLGLHSGSNYDKGKTLATVGNGNITVGGEAAEPEGLNRDVDAVDKELYSIERTKADLDLTVDNQTLVDIADAVVALKNELQSWGEQAPPEVQVAVPKIMAHIEQAQLEGKDVSALLEVMHKEGFNEAIAGFAPLAELAEKDPEALAAQLKENLDIKYVKDDQGIDRIEIVGREGDVPTITKLVDGLNSMKELMDSALTDDQQKIAEMIVAAAGGAASIVLNVVTGILAETEAGQAVLAKVAEGKETLGSYIGSAASGLESVDEFTDALGNEQREKNSNFYGSMQGGGEAALELAAIFVGLKGIKKKSGDGDSGSSSNSGNSSQGANGGQNNSRDVEANRLASEKVNQVTAPIDFDGHILKAEVKPNGDVVGGHSTVTGDVRVIPGTELAPNAQGVYSAKIEVADPSNPGFFLPKTNNGGVATMFPKSWSADRIKVEVDAAFQSKTVIGNKWTGTTPSGVKVEGYISPKTTVYPKL